MESMYHVLQWTVLRCVRHGMPRVTLENTLDSIFSEMYKSDNDGITCFCRLYHIRHSLFQSCVSLNNVLGGVLEDLRNGFLTRYTPIDDIENAQECRALYIQHKKDGDLSEDMLNWLGRVAVPAIRLEKLNDSKWFAELLRNAASNSQCPTNDASVLQEYPQCAPEWWAGNAVDPPNGEYSLVHHCSGREELPRKRQRQNTNENDVSDEGSDEKLKDSSP